MKKINVPKLIFSIALPLGIGFLSGYLSKNTISQDFIQPKFSPPSFIFGIVWPILYILMGVASYLVWNSSCNDCSDKKNALGLYLVQLVVNFLWPLVFFNLKNIGASLIIIVILLILIIITAIKFYKINKAAGYLFIPYILWVAFATVLNTSYFILNR
ncbi:tryptophan-rich sensory protein [Clostridiaceae bacterium M8S5]|nr:tryptophan-rich sensory protein [Clostridiaceae bacterium M8S5]